MEHISLSVLICHLAQRELQFKPLHDKLFRQTLGSSAIEILVRSDSGEESVGVKRNALLFDAKGEYVAFVDDDDDVSDDYIDAIMTAIASRPDCVGMEGVMQSSKHSLLFRHSIQFQGWYTGIDAFYRTPNHLNPIKRTIAQSIGFPDLRFGEDQRYSQALRRALRSEVYIGHPIYFYKKEIPDV